GDLHPEHLTDPDLSLATYSARVTPRRLPPFVERGLLPANQLAHLSRDDPPPRCAAAISSTLPRCMPMWDRSRPRSARRAATEFMSIAATRRRVLGPTFSILAISQTRPSSC